MVQAALRNHRSRGVGLDRCDLKRLRSGTAGEGKKGDCRQDDSTDVRHDDDYESTAASVNRRRILGRLMQMPRTRNMISGLLAAAVLAWGQAAPAPKAGHKAPTAADWAALGKLPDFTGVWEIPLGGGAARGGAGANRTGGGRGPAAQPSLTPEYAAKAKAEADARQAARAEDNLSANCLPPGMPGIMSQPYPIEVLMTPGQVTIVIEAYTQVRHIYTDGPTDAGRSRPSFDGTSIRALGRRHAGGGDDGLRAGPARNQLSLQREDEEDCGTLQARRSRYAGCRDSRRSARIRWL